MLLEENTLNAIRYGTVQYERGFEVIEIEGWVKESGTWLLIYGNIDKPVLGQRHTAIPCHRVIEVDYMVMDV